MTALYKVLNPTKALGYTHQNQGMEFEGFGLMSDYIHISIDHVTLSLYILYFSTQHQELFKIFR